MTTRVDDQTTDGLPDRDHGEIDGDLDYQAPCSSCARRCAARVDAARVDNALNRRTPPLPRRRLRRSKENPLLPRRKW